MKRGLKLVVALGVGIVWAVCLMSTTTAYPGSPAPFLLVVIGAVCVSRTFYKLDV